MHSADEVRRIRQLQKEGTLKDFLPEVFYHDKKSGTVVMRYYPKFKDFESQADAMGEIISHLIYKATRIRCSDVHTENIRCGKSRLAILIDLGY